ncbi:tumor necrosis factor receptor superfamily member 5-like [Mobula hypostoma]|uniref:tumor necrosis factor receptor superfamily member 5-like n=1 Tax=Mobula hypostoma TaxID=723540 RepID=UPI002FC3BAE1
MTPASRTEVGADPFSKTTHRVKLPPRRRVAHSRDREARSQRSAIARMFPLSFLLLLAPVHGEAPCSHLEYRGDHRCCKMCPAGSYVAQDCTLTRETQCRPCQDGEFTASDNGQLSCLRCKACDPGHGLEELSPCTRTSPRTCRCAPGFVCMASEPGRACLFCRREDACPAGQGASSAGNKSGDALCRPCAAGTFSSSPSRTPCQPWTRCSDLGLFTLRDGTSVSDATCGPTPAQPPWVLALVLAWALVCVLLLVITCLVFRRANSSSRTKKRIPELS